MYLAPAKKLALVDYLMNVISKHIAGALTSEKSSKCFWSRLFAAPHGPDGAQRPAVTELLETIFKLLMRIVSMVVKLAPIAPLPPWLSPWASSASTVSWPSPR